MVTVDPLLTPKDGRSVNAEESSLSIVIVTI